MIKVDKSTGQNGLKLYIVASNKIEANIENTLQEWTTWCKNNYFFWHYKQLTSWPHDKYSYH